MCNIQKQIESILESNRKIAIKSINQCGNVDNLKYYLLKRYNNFLHTNFVLT